MNKPDCKTCGLCCVSMDEADVYCDLLPEDALRLPKKYHRHFVAFDTLSFLSQAIDGRKSLSECSGGALKTRWINVRGGPLKGFELCACALLRGTPLKNVRCAIYQQRPSTCREAVKPGDRACKWFRREIELAIEG